MVNKLPFCFLKELETPYFWAIETDTQNLYIHKNKSGFQMFLSDVSHFQVICQRLKSNKQTTKRKTLLLSTDKGQMQQKEAKDIFQFPLKLKPFVYFLDLFEKRKPKPT